MKKWTIVVEITDGGSDNVHQGETVTDFLTRGELESIVSDALSNILDVTSKFQIMEIIEAPYGPQHKNGVYLDTREGPRKAKGA